MYPDNWRYCKVIGKNPNIGGKGWKNRPYKLCQTLSFSGKGLLLGPLSGGVCAIDFDGYYGSEWFEANIGSLDCLLVNTPAWTSGKEGRCQMAFNVPKEHWDTLQPKFLADKMVWNEKLQEDEMKSHLEFRWAGNQSVVPPSPHPDGGKYFWVVETSEVATIPKLILDYWLDLCKPYIPIIPTQTVNTTENNAIALEALQIIKAHCPNMTYRDWRDLAWSVIASIGPYEAEITLKQLWPEKVKDEYKNLIEHFDQSRSPKMGSLVARARKYKPNFLKKQEPMTRFLNTLNRRRNK